MGHAMKPEEAVEALRRGRTWEEILSHADRLLDHVQAAVIATDLTGRIRYANRFAAELYGVAREELVGAVSADFASSPVEPALANEIARALLAGEGWSGDFVIRRSDGAQRTVRASDSGIYDERGALVGVVSVAIDVTERRAIERSLTESEARKSAILEAALDGLVAIDRSGRITEWNPAAAAMFGWTREEAMGRPMAELIIPADWRAAHREGFARHLATGEQRILGRRIEVQALRRGGDVFPAELAVTRIEGGAEDGFLAAIRDITLRRRAEQALVESRERFAHLAQTLQQSLLPPSLPDVPGLEVAAHYRPAGDGSEVGGDFYEVFETGRADWAVMIGDVQGKGAAAAAVTALARYTARAAAMKNRKPSVILAVVNEAVLRQHPERFCTMVYARVRPTPPGFRVTFASGGHPLPVLLHHGRARPVGRPGQLVGGFEELRVTNTTLDLVRGDTLVFFTDGVTEARSGHDLFGDERLTEVLESLGERPVSTLVEGIAERVVDFQGGDPVDDLALLALRVL